MKEPYYTFKIPLEKVSPKYLWKRYDQTFAITLHPSVLWHFYKSACLVQGLAIPFLKVLYMSIVALKRNSRRFQVPISANGFSLNGGHRNQRLIGNTNLSALTNGNNNICSANDPSIVKTSTKNTKGYIYSTVLFPTCPVTGCEDGVNREVNWVKNFSPEDHSAGQYITDVVISNSALCVTEKPDSGTNTVCNTECRVRAYHIGGRYVYTTFNAKNSGKPYQQGAITAGEYLKAGLLKYKKYNAACGVTPESIAPIPPALLNSGCIHC